jgi:hypothetical protein
VTHPSDEDGDQGGNSQLIMWIMLCLAVLSTYSDLVGVFRG